MRLPPAQRNSWIYGRNVPSSGRRADSRTSGFSFVLVVYNYNLSIYLPFFISSKASRFTLVYRLVFDDRFTKERPPDLLLYL